MTVAMLLVLGLAMPAVWAADAGTGSATANRIRLCTAQSGNNYHRAGQKIRALLEGRIKVDLVETRGSWENLAAIGESRRSCDAIIAQDDAYALHEFERPDSFSAMKRLGTLFPEHVHVICPRSLKAKSLLEAVKAGVDIVVNQYGSGSYITWKLFGRLNPIYRRAHPIELPPEQALLRIVESRRPACMFYVSRAGGRALEMADRKFGDRLHLLEVRDRKLHRPVGRDRIRVYEDSVIPAQNYARMQDGDVRTQSVGAAFFVSPKWMARHPRSGRMLAEAIIDLLASSEKSR
jgi:TRAP-type uncharacterized transport system substrate-binding protein